MRTQDEIVARLKERQGADVFGFEWHEYAIRLDAEHFREFAKDDADLSDWEPESAEPAKVKDRMREYMPFAWEKANNNRGISASRSVMHIQAWLWLMGEDEFLREFDAIEFEHYGKAKLVAVCERYGWDWREWDDDRWTNYEDEDGITADEALGRVGAA